MAGSLRELLGMVPQPNGTIGQPYRPPHMEALGTLASLLEKAGQYASKVGVTVPQGSPVMPGASLTLRDLTIGDLPRVLEDISYGMGPTTGGNYATGGIGTLGGMKSDVFELANAAPGAALLGKGLAKGGRALAPTAAEMLRKNIEKAVDSSGGRMYIFGGEGAKNLDARKLEEAKKMILQGQDPLSVFRKTGFFTAKDEKWRFEIPDIHQASLKDISDGEKTLDAVLSHPRLFEAYPDLRSIKTTIKDYGDSFNSSMAWYSPVSDEIGLNSSRIAEKDPMLNFLLHELQHAVQKREGFAQGGNPSIVGRDAYERLLGEKEARLVQAKHLGERRNPVWTLNDQDGFGGEVLLSAPDIRKKK